MKHLYELTQEMEELIDAEDVENTMLEQVFGDIQLKAENIVHFIANLDADVATFKAEEQRIAARRKAMEHAAKRTKDYLKFNMERLGMNELKAGTFKITLSPTAGTLEIDDEKAIPQRFCTVVQSVTIDKAGIKAAIKQGESIPGCHIQPGSSLRIR